MYNNLAKESLLCIDRYLIHTQWTRINMKLDIDYIRKQFPVFK